MVLASLSEASLLSLAKEKVLTLDLPWLNSLIEGGWLDMAHQFKDMVSARQRNAMDNQLLEKAKALTAFIALGEMGFHRDEHGADLFQAPLMTLELPSALFHTTSLANFQAFYASSCQQMVTTLGLLVQNHGPSNKAHRHGKASIEAMGRLMAGACVLDLPDVLKSLITVCPSGMETSMDKGALGSHVETNAFTDEADVHMSAGFVALQFSRIACLDVLADAAPLSPLFLGHYPDSNGMFKGLEFVDNLHSLVAQPLCNIVTMTHALRHALAASTQQDTGDMLIAAGLRAMRRGSDIRMLDYVASFTEAGIYAMNPTRSLREACMTGHVAVVESLAGRVPWETLAPSFTSTNSIIYQGLVADVPDGGDRVGAVEAMMRMAKNEGHAHTVGVLFDAPQIEGDDTSDVVIQPFFEALDLNATPILLAYLEQGLDPVRSPGEGRLSPIALAQSLNSDACDLLRSWVARRTASHVLALIECGNEEDAAPGPALPGISMRP